VILDSILIFIFSRSPFFSILSLAESEANEAAQKQNKLAIE